MKNFEKLLAGSAEINRMTAAINQITKTMLGMLDPDKVEVDGPIIIPCASSHEWRVSRVLRVRNGESQKSRWVVEFYEKGEWVSNSFLLYSTNPLNRQDPGLRHVQVIYDCLEELVNYFLGHHRFEHKLRPLLYAADEVATK